MALYISQSILHLARSLYVRLETYGPTYVIKRYVIITLFSGELTVLVFLSFFLSCYAYLQLELLITLISKCIKVDLNSKFPFA